MGAMKNRLVGLALFGAGAALIYRFGISDGAKQSLKEAIGTIGEVVERISELMGEMSGQTVEDNYLPNREQTIAQWERLGY